MKKKRKMRPKHPAVIQRSLTGDERIDRLFAEKKALAQALLKKGIQIDMSSGGTDSVLEWL